MRTRTARGIAWLLLGVDLVLTAVGLWLVVLNRHTPLPPGTSSVLTDAALLLAFLPFAVLGALIFSRRPGNRIGLILLVAGLGMSVGLTAFEYAIYAALTNPRSFSLQSADRAVRVNQWLAVVPFLAYMFLFLLFPDGHLPSRRWLPAAGLAVVSMGWLEANAVDPTIPLDPARALALATMLLCGAAPVVRYRHAASEERQQIKWFALAALPAAALLTPGLYINPPDVLLVLFVAATALVPFGAAIAIFKYRLYDIDVIINKALVYGGLAAFVTVAYVVVVVGIGAFIGATTGLSVVATAIVAVAFQPVRRRVQALANRLVYGERAAPYEVLAEFSKRVGEAYAAEEILPRMVRILGEGTGASRADVWLRAGAELRPAASWPDGARDSIGPQPIVGDELPEFSSVSAAVAVRDQGELLGALTVSKPANDPVRPAEGKLLADLGSQAGLWLRNLALIADLKASRQRLVAAQDEERRRLERNLHDGAQQQIVALSIKQRLMSSFLSKDPDRAAELLEQLQTDAAEALDTLRDLARGIYPPLLADKGIAAALEAQLRKVPLPVTLEATDIGRYSQDIEAAVYFCCLEALQNISKYANASAGSIELATSDTTLTFTVADDGAGFDPATTGYGTGLQGMADRLAAIGGTLDLRSAPGRGTTVTGTIPLS